MSGVRRSGRIPKQIPIVLVGTDTLGRVFSEETNTVLLSRHGAGILSRNKLAPDEVLTIRIAGTNREAEVRLAGAMGTNAYGTIYGLAFRDERLDFWQMAFPPANVASPGDAETLLECSLCRRQERVRQTEVEADVYAVNEMVLRYCGVCGITTRWRPATAATATRRETERPLSPRQESAPAAATQPSSAAPPHRSEPAPRRSFYEGGGALELVAAHVVVTPQDGAAGPDSGAANAIASDAMVLPAPQPRNAPSAPQNAPVPESPAGTARRPNQRAHVRTRVTFTACIRQGMAEEVVECENVSRGGFCFRSRKRYGVETLIDAALPYSPGQQALFVAAAIKRREELPSGNMYRYGCAYLKPAR